MALCLDCGKATAGSVGAAGIFSSFTCQRCRDIADGLLRAQVNAQAWAFTKLADAMFGKDKGSGVARLVKTKEGVQ